MRRILIIIIVLLFSFHLKAQIPYITGSYYNISGQKISGLIQFLPNWDYIHIRSDKNARSEKIKIKDISGIVMIYGGITENDTLTVLTENNKENERYFAKFFFATPTTRFYNKYIGTSGGGVPSMTSLSVPNSTNNGSHNIIRWSTSSRYFGTEKIIMYQDGNTSYELTKSNFIDVLSKAFADVPDLVQQIQNKKFKFKQFGDIFYQYQSQSTYKSN